MRRRGFDWLADIIRSSKTVGPTGWCTVCNGEVIADHDHPRACGRLHPGRIKQVPSLELTEDDCAVLLMLIETERDVPWRLVVKLYETVLDAVAGECSMRDERGAAERVAQRWEEAFERHAREPLGDYTPDEACAVLAGMGDPPLLAGEAVSLNVSKEELGAIANLARLRRNLANMDGDARRRIFASLSCIVEPHAPMAADALKGGV